MLNISVAEQSSLASKSSTTSFQPCAPADGCFSRSIRSSTQSRGSITSLSSLTPTPFFFSQNRACASGDSQYDALAIYLALGLGLISVDVKKGSAGGCANCFGAKFSISDFKKSTIVISRNMIPCQINEINDIIGNTASCVSSSLLLG